MGIPGTVPPILCYMYNPENSVQSHGTYNYTTYRIVGIIDGKPGHDWYVQCMCVCVWYKMQLEDEKSSVRIDWFSCSTVHVTCMHMYTVFRAMSCICTISRSRKTVCVVKLWTCSPPSKAVPSPPPPPPPPLDNTCSFVWRPGNEANCTLHLRSLKIDTHECAMCYVCVFCRVTSVERLYDK